MSKLRERRIAAGLSQCRLAALTGIASPDISAIERGRKRPFPRWRKRLALALETDEAELFADFDKPAPEATR
jgi:transcriptional regulator with XRE-family HTH domain